MKMLLFLVFMLSSLTAQADIKLELNGFLHENQKHLDPRKRPRTYARQIPLSKEDKDFAKRTISKAINLLPRPIRELNLKKNIKIIFWNFEKNRDVKNWEITILSPTKFDLPISTLRNDRKKSL